jgi:hypothetical protein
VDTKELELHILYLRRKSAGIYYFPIARDEDHIKICSVEAKLEEPKVERRGGELFFEELKDMDI